MGVFALCRLDLLKRGCANSDADYGREICPCSSAPAIAHHWTWLGGLPALKSTTRRVEKKFRNSVGKRFDHTDKQLVMSPGSAKFRMNFPCFLRTMTQNSAKRGVYKPPPSCYAPSSCLSLKFNYSSIEMLSVSRVPLGTGTSDYILCALSIYAHGSVKSCPGDTLKGQLCQQSLSEVNFPNQRWQGEFCNGGQTLHHLFTDLLARSCALL